jgi:amino acid permease
MVTATFAYLGTELVGVTVGEAQVSSSPTGRGVPYAQVLRIVSVRDTTAF